MMIRSLPQWASGSTQRLIPGLVPGLILGLIIGLISGYKLAGQAPRTTGNNDGPSPRFPAVSRIDAGAASARPPGSQASTDADPRPVRAGRQPLGDTAKSRSTAGAEHRSVFVKWQRLEDAELLMSQRLAINPRAAFNHVWLSNKDGWSPGTYLIEIFDPELRHRIARGDYVVRGLSQSTVAASSPTSE